MKKSEPVTYRTDKKTKEVLSQIAEEKKWSISQLSEEIIKEWLQEKRPELLEKITKMPRSSDRGKILFILRK